MLKDLFQLRETCTNIILHIIFNLRLVLGLIYLSPCDTCKYKKNKNFFFFFKFALLKETNFIYEYLDRRLV